MLKLLLVPALSTLATSQEPGVPPGLVELGGGRTTIGLSARQIEDLVEEQPSEAGTKVHILDRATPQHTLVVGPFRLGRTEVTNEQYAEFVRATGHRPPLEWGMEAVEEGRRAYFEQVGLALEQGRSKPEEFGPETWWEENWQGLPWSVPEGAELRPVVFVGHADVLAYCRWAGLRLPTEFEFQCAVRGGSKDPYPWGDEWRDGEFAATSEGRRSGRSQPVGSFPAGASRQGLLDLAGNVWEWTSSPYQAYPGHEKNEYRVPGPRRKSTTPVHRWDGNQRVVVGGAFTTSRLAARCEIRRAAERDESKDALGFRVASTPVPARDAVGHVWESVLRGAEARPAGVTYDLDGVLGLEAWSSRPGGEGAPEGYRVITGHHHLALVPRTELEHVSEVTYRKASLVEPQHLGFLTLTMPAAEPRLAPGTYLIAFRAAGDTRYEASSDEPEVDPWSEVLDIGLDHLVLLDAATGQVVATQVVTEFGARSSEGDAGVELLAGPGQGDEPADPVGEVQARGPRLRVKGEVRTSRRRRVLPFALELTMEPGFALLAD